MTTKLACPSVDALVDAAKLTTSQAKLIRAVWKAKTAHGVKALCPAHLPPSSEMPLVNLKFSVIRRLGGYQRICYLGTYKKTGEPLYCMDAGNDLNWTLMFHGSRMYIGNERTERQQRESFLPSPVGL